METAPQIFSAGSVRSLEATLVAELRVPLVTVRLVHFIVTESTTIDFEEAPHRLDLSLTPRPRGPNACYPERWSSHRFEEMGDVAFIPGGEPIRVVVNPGRQATINCFLHADRIRDLFEEDLAFTDRQLDASLDVRSGNIRSLILRLGEEARHPGFASEMLAEMIAGQIVVELFRYRDGARIDGPAKGGVAPWRLRRIDERLEELSEVPTLAELAELCGLSVRQLTRGFRASRDCSIGEYVAQRQIDRAKKLLATEDRIKSIAYVCGFASPANFCNAFRRATGESPREYRQRERRIRH